MDRWRFIATFALRNLMRNPRRTILTILTVITAVTASIIAQRYAVAVVDLWRDGAADTGTAHVQIHRRGYWQRQEGLDPNQMLKMDSDLEAIVRADSAVIAVSRRLAIEGLLHADSGSTYFLGKGIEPKSEMAVSPRLFTRHDRGEFAPSYDQVTIGKGMADALQLDLGASVTLVSPTAGALADAIDGTVAGIVDASIPSFSSRIVFTDLALLQRVARLPKVYSELAIRLHKDTDMEAWVKTMQQKLDSHGVGENSVEVKGWWELEPIIRNVGEIIDGIVYLISFLLFAAAALSVTNMIYLIVVERIIEIGTLLAIGVRRKYIMALFAAEGLLTGGVSGGLGAFLGFSAIALMGWQGLEFPSPFGGDPIVIRPSPSAPIALAIWFIATIVCGLVAILPAARAAKVNPTEAYRGVV